MPMAAICIGCILRFSHHETRFPVLSKRKKPTSYASVNCKREHPPPPGQPPGFCTYFHPGSPGFVPSGLPGGGPITKVPSCQLMLHEDTFQLQTDLPSVDAL